MTKLDRKRREAIARRDVLRGAVGLATAGVAARFGMPSIARAASQVASQRRFVFVWFGGGWDQLLFLDPRDPAADGGRFADANRAQTLTEARYAELAGTDFAPRVVRAGDLAFGPAAISARDRGAPITKHADRIAILRGMNMGTLAHGTGYYYFRTARFPVGDVPRGSSIDVECAAIAGATEAVPVVSLGLYAANQGYPGAYGPMTIASIGDLVSVLDRGKEYVEKDAVEDALAAYARASDGASIAVHDRDGLVAGMRDADQRARAMLASRLADRFRFTTADDEASAAIRARYGIAKGEDASPAARAAFAAQAIKQKVARCVSIAIVTSLDTHLAGNRAHAEQLHPGIAALAALIDDLATTEAPEELQKIGGRTWLDHTTILAHSEFARTPLFNPSGGRDHHLASSCLLAGAGIAGGRVVGETGAVAMGACRYDFANDRVVPSGGDAIGPEHVRATLLASAGLPYEGVGIHAPPIRALIGKGGR